MVRIASLITAAGLVTLAGCAVAPPTGPSVMVLPGKDKSFEAFQQDDGVCRSYAAQAIGYGAPAQAAEQGAVDSAVIGTALGAAAGAVIGAAAGNPGAGAAIGAGSGLLVGSASGAGAAQYSEFALQQQFDRSYVQCMYSKGNSVPPVLAGAGPYGYGYPAYPYGYPAYAYAYPPFYGPAFVGFGFGFGEHHHRR